MIFIWILLSVIAVFSIMSYLSLREISKLHRANRTLVDDRYYELKYKLQFVSTVGILIIGVGGFFGYDKYDAFVDRFQNKANALDLKFKEYEKKTKSIDSMMISYDGKVTSYKEFIKSLNSGKTTLPKEALEFNKQLVKLKTPIDNSKKVTILDNSFYVIDDLRYQGASQTQRFYYKDLTTITGEKLPFFKKKPVLFLMPQSGAELLIQNITNEYIEVVLGSYTTITDEEPKYFSFGLLIAK